MMGRDFLRDASVRLGVIRGGPCVAARYERCPVVFISACCKRYLLAVNSDPDQAADVFTMC
ncbi:hypothetical protein C0V97_09960 [Asaia sp. W19]|nr:hypothetical protein C0V97_09960 [Asaia sp. W19]